MLSDSTRAVIERLIEAAIDSAFKWSATEKDADKFESAIAEARKLLEEPASEDAWLKDAVRLVGNYGTAHRKDVKLATDETCNIAAQTTRELLDHLRARTAKEQNNG